MKEKDKNVQTEPYFSIMRDIKKRRLKLHLTQQELSRRTGIIQADISKLETGLANPSIRTLARIAQGLGMTLHVEFIDTH